MKLSQLMSAFYKALLPIEIIGILSIFLMAPVRAEVTEALQCDFPVAFNAGTNAAPHCIVPKRTGGPFSSRAFGLPTQKGVNEALSNALIQSQQREAVLRQEIAALKAELVSASKNESDRINTEIGQVQESIGQNAIKLPELIINDPRFRALIEEAIRKTFIQKNE